MASLVVNVRVNVQRKIGKREPFKTLLSTMSTWTEQTVSSQNDIDMWLLYVWFPCKIMLMWVNKKKILRLAIWSMSTHTHYPLLQPPHWHTDNQFPEWVWPSWCQSSCQIMEKVYEAYTHPQTAVMRMWSCCHWTGNDSKLWSLSRPASAWLVLATCWARRSCL